MDLREDKWEIVVLVAAALSTVDLTTHYSGWAGVSCLVLGIFCFSTQLWELCVKQRKRRDLRRAWLTHFDRLLRDEVRRR